MIKLIVGLGNPGQKYEKTRHNVGFLFLDYLLERQGGRWSQDNRFHGLVAECQVDGSKLILLKPQTFMNRSGLSVRALLNYWKFSVDEMLVVHDELDLDEAAARLKLGGGHAGHNGLRDIIAHLNSKDFYRLRIGIARPVEKNNVADYVLSRFSKEAEVKIESVFTNLEKNLLQIVKGDINLAMNIINRK